MEMYKNTVFCLPLFENDVTSKINLDEATSEATLTDPEGI